MYYVLKVNTCCVWCETNNVKWSWVETQFKENTQHSLTVPDQNIIISQQIK